jgi:hypothetical protein
MARERVAQPGPEVLPAESRTAHEFLEAVWNDPAVPLPLRIRAAVEALPFERPKLAATYSLGEGLGRRLEEAWARSEGRLDVTSPQPDETDQ